MKITLRQNELILSKDDKETIVPFDQIESFETTKDGKYDILFLRARDGSEIKLGMPREPRLSEVLSEVKVRLSNSAKKSTRLIVKQL